MIILTTEIRIAKMHSRSTSVVFLSLIMFVFVNSYHVRHDRQRSPVFPDADVNVVTSADIVNSLSESELSEKFDENVPEDSSRIRGIPESNQPPPVYLSLMYEKLSTEKMTVPSTDVFGDIVRALFPSVITSGEFGSSSLVFNVSPGKIGNYSSAHLILTRNGKIDNHSQSHVNVKIQFENQQNMLSERIMENERFYTFNITSLLGEALKAKGEEASIDLKCDVFKNVRKKIWFEKVFDIETEKPFIIFEYQDVNMARFIVHQENPETSQNQISTRKRRSVAVTESSPTKRSLKNQAISNGTSVAASRNTIETVNSTDTQPFPSLEPPVKTVCRRHEWLASPSEVGLDDVIKPEKLDLGFCGGSCPYPLLNDFFNFTLHSYFVDHHRLLKGFNVPNGFPVSNCVPVSYKPLMVMEIEEDGGYLLRTYMEASVDSCGCR